MRVCGAWTALLAALLGIGARGQQKGLFPAIFNLASNALISTNATCGEKGPEMFCKLVEHVPTRPVRNAQCQVCDDHSSNPKERHPILHAIDGSNNWWQSPSIQNGREFHWVTITLDLRQVFQVAYIIIKAANSPRPGNWILERSLNGTTFSPWQYYAVSDTECLTRYNITPRQGTPTYRADDEVICTSYYSKLVPLEHGEIHTSLINGRPSTDDLSPELLEFTSARYIRLRLQRIRTLNADLMTLSHRDPRDLDPIVTRRYFYSIKDISVGGMCICHGHASSCPRDETTKKLQCQCEHNTCGESCNRCCPGYHQQPWRPGTVSLGNTCEECNCHNKAKDCYYDENVANQNKSLDISGQFRGGGVCINCQQNTMGINCESCVDGYYRPHKISPYDDNPCRPCACDPAGSLGSVCIKDDLHSDINNGKWPGQCACKEGYAGEKCDRCQFGYSGFPHCVPCNCSLAGSVNDDPCAEPCVCKENVEGHHCDRCKSGFFNLKESNPQGCVECFCFGVSVVCDSLSWPVAQVKEMSGWTVTDLVSPSSIRPQQEMPGGRHQLRVNSSAVLQKLASTYYWSAPKAYLGNKLTAFGGLLKYTVSYEVPVEAVDGDFVAHADVIIKGNGLSISTQVEGLSLQPYEEYFNAVRLVPENFRNVNNGKEIDRDQLMTVLANVTHLLIRANYNSAKMALFRLHSVSLDVASRNAVDLAVATDVERCECPSGFTGMSCESCLPGYYRVDGILFGGICNPCECHGHASECDIHGVCFACSDNTTGDHCERCLPGFYGDPSQGTPGDCQPCACPLSIPSNNFSPTCHLSGNQSVCDQCAPGYSGAWCERCANGYYGNPAVPGGICIPCNCSGNVDPSEEGHCDSVTGECLKCVGNTAGAHCERCADGFYGDAVIAKNCRACGCHEKGSLSGVCHLETGVCDCQSYVTGRRCDQCMPGYYGLGTGFGCLPCHCNPAGSTSDECTEDGQCHCVPGVAGLRCDRCAQGFYASQDGGCTPCDCAHTKNNCDPVSGECICPPHTRGPKCEECQQGFWGWDQQHGCQACNCSREGSADPQCDLRSGHCQCTSRFGGWSCDRCSLGFRDFPDCVACDCDPRGTLPDTCDLEQGLCSCVEETGACSCKENVFGPHCSECRPGSFALHTDNPQGCIPCFCFGQSTVCSELEGHVRTPVTLGSHQPLLHVVSQSNLKGTAQGVSYEAASIVLDAGTVREHVHTEPFYWKLPEPFQGDKLLAYGGTLRYTVAFYASDAIGTSNFEPQILIRGGRTRKQIIYMDAPAPENGVSRDYEVQMKEIFWKYFNAVSEEPVTRSDFMSVLSHIDHILIKASYGRDLQQSRISNISMEVSTKAIEPQPAGKVATLLEKCLCPPGTAGFSCQDCAPGYYRGKLPETGAWDPRPLLAPCVPCTCSNHSETCHPETGKCLACRDNTAGDHCDVCAPGYYGKVTGSASDCSPCTCPLHHPASFSPTCVLEGDGGFRCDACSPGYEGRYCEWCSAGYYGNPGIPGGRCQECDCNPQGSVHSDCDRTSGQCTCKPGAAGIRCEKCLPRHLLLESVCVSCDDKCVGTLLDDLDALDKAILPKNLSGVFPASYKMLSKLENTTQDLRESLLKEHMSKNRAKSQVEAVAGQTEKLQRKLTQVLARSQQVSRETETLRKESQGLAAFVERLQEDVTEILAKATTLNQTFDEDAQLPNLTLQTMQWNISSLLEIIQEMNFTYLHEKAINELNAAEDLLIEIKRKFQEPREELEVLKEAVSRLLSKHKSELQAAEKFLEDAEAKIQETNILLPIIKANLRQFADKKMHVEKEGNLTAALVAEGRGLRDTAALQVDATKKALAHLESHQDELLLWTANLRNHVDDLVMQMSKKEASSLVYRAENYTAELQTQAAVLENSLKKVRRVSLNATSAAHIHSKLRDLVEEAEKLASDAYGMARKTSLVSRALALPRRDALQHSAKALQDGEGLSRNQQDLALKLSKLKTTARGCQEKVGKIAKQANESLLKLRAIPEGVRDRAAQAKELATAVNRSAERALNEVMELSQKLINSSAGLASANSTFEKADIVLQDTTMATLMAGKRVNEAVTKVNLLLNRLKPFMTLKENLSRNLSEIKLLISQARKQADSIKVAVVADRNCVRAYQPRLSSTNYNSLTLTVKTQAPDNLLFYLGSSTGPDFLALEMLRGHVSFLWDLGSGSTRLEFPDFPINDNEWYTIHATRFGNTGLLSVKGLNSVPKPSTVTSKSPGTANVLDINNSTLMFVGGLGGQVKKSPAVKVTHFKGCMGEAFLNGKSIGLWNYVEREGECQGCFASPQKEDSSFHFDGNGYAVVEKPLRATVTQITMFFRTFSPSGLLLYLASNGTKDCLSIELVNGRVKVLMDLGSGPLVLVTDRRYNNGTWYKISFQRNRKQGLLAVTDAYDTSDKETRQGEAPGPSSDLNRMDRDPIYVGGVPPASTVRKGIGGKSYMGCIKNLEISRSTFDLLRNAYGVRKGCVLEPTRSVSFLEGGYLELPPVSLAPQSELLVTFATLNSSGIILAALGQDVGERPGRQQVHAPFFSVLLIDGHVEVHVDPGDGSSLRKALLHAPHGTYGDGQAHSVSVARNRRIITVQLDETNPVEVRLGPLVENKAVNVSHLYLGGVPEGVGTSVLKMRASFQGCVKNLILGVQLLDFTNAVGYEQADMDTCLLLGSPQLALPREDLEPLPEPQPLPHPKQCAEDTVPGDVPGAHQFGLSQSSHVVLPLNQSVVRKRLLVQLKLRTFAPSGLIYYMAHQNQLDYATLQLHGGRPHFMFDLGKGQTKVSHPAQLNDGKWHTVKTEFVKRKAFITVDGQESPAVTMVGDATSLDVEGKLYLGGLPAHYRARKLGSITHSIPACIREVTVNNKQMDKESPLSSSAVGRCFAVAQEGTFFEGNGYAAFVKEGYRVRSDLNISLEFRTSSENGVLLGISSAKVDAVGLEMVNGELLFCVNNGAGRMMAVYQPGAARTLCDGRWHTLQASKSKHHMVLAVDGNMVVAENPYPHSTSVDTHDPIYVGGYPADVKQNCLGRQAPFRGCLRRLTLTRGSHVQTLDFSSAFDLRGVVPHSCPRTEP